MTSYPLTTIALVAVLLVYMWIAGQVGKARGVYGVQAPASSGHPEFDKRYRVQLNTVEQLVLLLPATFLALPVLTDRWTALAAAVFALGRVIYARAYWRDPKSRTLGFMLSLVPILVLMIAAVVGAVRTLANI